MHHLVVVEYGPVNELVGSIANLAQKCKTYHMHNLRAENPQWQLEPLYVNAIHVAMVSTYLL